MPWSVILHEAFDAEFQALEEALQDELLAHARLLQSYGPHYILEAIRIVAIGESSCQEL
jgi:hypothetical protein